MSPEILAIIKNKGSEQLHSYIDSFVKACCRFTNHFSGSCFPSLLQMHAMIQVEETDTDAVVEKFLNALQGFYQQRNNPEYLSCQHTFQKIVVLECQG